MTMLRDEQRREKIFQACLRVYPEAANLAFKARLPFPQIIEYTGLYCFEKNLSGEDVELIRKALIELNE